MISDDKNLRLLQRKYIAAGAIIAPLAPFLWLQGTITRFKIGVLPDAGGEKTGVAGTGGDPAPLLVIGESTVAGLGAKTHDVALAGQFAARLSEHIGRFVNWHVVGKSGVTARRTIEELVPQIPDQQFEFILVGLGGNDVLKLSSPRRWRSDMIELLGILREKNPSAVIFLSNCPMIIYSPALPEPSKSILWGLSKMHDANIREFTAEMDRVFYYPQPAEVRLEGFFADGIHPSEKGYADWSRAMIKYFTENHEW
jgi:lysophospholipase L1-like esterase